MSGYTHRTKRICRNQQLKVVFLGSNDWSVIIDAIIQEDRPHRHVWSTRAEVQVTTSKTERNLFHFLAEALVLA